MISNLTNYISYQPLISCYVSQYFTCQKKSKDCECHNGVTMQILPSMTLIDELSIYWLNGWFGPACPCWPSSLTELVPIACPMPIFRKIFPMHLPGQESFKCYNSTIRAGSMWTSCSSGPFWYIWSIERKYCLLCTLFLMLQKYEHALSWSVPNYQNITDLN